MVAAEINVDEDATDEEVEEDAVVSSSDEEVEKDVVIFDSDEDNDDSGKDNDDSDEDGSDLDKDDDNSDDTESESSYYEEVQKDLSTKLKDDKLKNKSKNKKSLTSKGKASRETTVINKLKNEKNHRNFDETHKNDTNKQETENISDNAKDDKNEYVYDSSDEEDIRNTVGNIPMKWYDEHDHLGYDWEGKKIPKPEKGDELDNFLKRMEDPDFWRTIKDPQTGRDVVLSEADIDLIVRIQKQKVPDNQFDEYSVSYIFDNLV